MDEVINLCCASFHIRFDLSFPRRCFCASLHAFVITPPPPTCLRSTVDSASPCNRFQLKHNYCKFLPKTQSLDIVDESAIANIVSAENCFESINEELMQTAPPTDEASPKSSTMPKVTSLDNNAARPIFPNLSYSPYGSPRISRKPARESRRVSIDKNGSFLQLNQYKLLDQIGAVSSIIPLMFAGGYMLEIFREATA